MTSPAIKILFLPGHSHNTLGRPVRRRPTHGTPRTPPTPKTQNHNATTSTSHKAQCTNKSRACDPRCARNADLRNLTTPPAATARSSWSHRRPLPRCPPRPPPVPAVEHALRRRRRRAGPTSAPPPQRAARWRLVTRCGSCMIRLTTAGGPQRGAAIVPLRFAANGGAVTATAPAHSISDSQPIVAAGRPLPPRHRSRSWS